MGVAAVAVAVMKWTVFTLLQLLAMQFITGTLTRLLTRLTALCPGLYPGEPVPER